MYFNCDNADICVSYLTSTWEEGKWTPPERLGPPISTEFEEVEPVINTTGDKLYFTSNRPGNRLGGIPILSPFLNVFRVANTLATNKLGRTFFGGLGLTDVYVSTWSDGTWSEPRKLNDSAGEPPVNSAFLDHCLSFSSDGNEAFWTSTRPGGFGGNDIWTSRRVDGKWTAPENLGPNVNGPGDEHHSIPTPDGRSLYVTTMREGGYGHEDIYVTTRDADGKWGPLVNLGSQLNGPGDDRCPAWTPDLRIFLFDSVNQLGFGGRDIWWVYFEDVGYPLTAASASPYIQASRLQVPNDVVP
jgi:Tol biopolymer transport system component